MCLLTLKWTVSSDSDKQDDAWKYATSAEVLEDD
jgi:hypothetical protein